MQVHGYTSIGSISATIEGETWDVPDDMSSRFRQMIAKWEFDEAGNRVNTIPPYVPDNLPKPYRLYKTTLWVRLSDQDAETVMAAKEQQPAKFRGIWDDAQIIESDSEFFGALKTFLTATLSAEKAEALLQPES